MIIHINTWFSTWTEVVENFEGRGSMGWSVAPLKSKGTVLLKHGELAISKADFNPVVEEAGVKDKPDSTKLNPSPYKKPLKLDAKGRPTIKHTATFKRLVETTRKQRTIGGEGISPREQATLDGEEYFMLGKPCKTCGELHERHITRPCDRKLSVTTTYKSENPVATKPTTKLKVVIPEAGCGFNSTYTFGKTFAHDFTSLTSLVRPSTVDGKPTPIIQLVNGMDVKYNNQPHRFIGIMHDGVTCVLESKGKDTCIYVVPCKDLKAAY